MAIIKEGVRLLIPLEEYKALVAKKRAASIASSAATSHVEANEAYAPALVSREENEARKANEAYAPGMVSRGENAARKAACNGCEWKGDAEKCGCHPICNHEAVRTMEVQKAPNYWLKSSTCPAGKWTEEAKQ